MIYIINLNHDIGRKYYIESLKLPFDYELVDGVLKLDYDRYKTDKISEEIATRGTTESHIKCLRKGLDNNEDYTIILEDDIILHSNFEYFFNQVIDFIEHNTFKLFYLGFSSKMDLENKTFKIKELPDDRVYTGGYGYIINNSLIPEILEMAEQTHQPFDWYCLGYIQRKYYGQVFYTDPPLIITDVSTSNIRNDRDNDDFSLKMNWKLSLYNLSKTIPVFVMTDNQRLFDLFCEKFKILKPICSFYKCEDIDYDIIRDVPYYIITSPLIDYRKPIINIFEIIEHFFGLNTIKKISFKVNYCDKCNINRKEYYDFNVIKTREIVDSSSVKLFDNDFLYTTKHCFSIEDTYYHKKEVEDIVDDIINRYDDINDRWVIQFIEWYKLKDFNIRSKMLNEDYHKLNRKVKLYGFSIEHSHMK